MVYSNAVLSQLLKLVLRHEIERLANQHDGKRRSDETIGDRPRFSVVRNTRNVACTDFNNVEWFVMAPWNTGR